MNGTSRLNEPAAPDAMLCVGAGKTCYLGTLDDLDWHLHGSPVFIAGMTGKLRLRLPGGDWLACRAAVISAGVRHELELGGEPLAVFYPEPATAGLHHLARLGGHWDVREGILFGQCAEIVFFRELYENSSSLAFAPAALADLVAHITAQESDPRLDPRVASVIAKLDKAPDDLSAVAALALAEGLSASRFLHLFSRDVGVPFRRFRIWNRVRAALGLAVAGRSLTEAALAAGFADSAHFARLHRETFGVAASQTLRRVARAGGLA